MIWAKIKALLIFLSPALALGFLIGMYPGYKVYKYTWEDAQFCTSCHVHDYATVGWKKSVHGDHTTCHDCHHQPLRAYVHELYLMITDPPTFPEDLHHTPYVKKDLCVACHMSGTDRSTITGPMSADKIAQIPKVDTSPLHKIHLDKTTSFTLLNSLEIPERERSANPQAPESLPRDSNEIRSITCADCHGGPTNRGHNFRATDINCVRCHQHTHNNSFIKENGCRSCHFQEFLTPDHKTK